MVGDEGVSGRGLWVQAHGGHAGVHEDPEGDVAPHKDGRLHLDDLAQEVGAGRSLRLPVLYSEWGGGGVGG